MSDQDNLRDRIARVLFDRDQTTLERRGYFKMRWEESDANYLKPWREEAQAIIDELGLTVETEPGHDPRECGCSSRAYPAESRIVGKWEEQCHR